MSHVQRVAVTVTTAADGSATAYTEMVTGSLATIRYVKGDFDNGSTITVTVEATGESVWAESNVNASATRAPRQATHSVAGVAALYAAGGAAVNDRIAVASDRFKIVVASGGNVKSGVFHFMLD